MESAYNQCHSFKIILYLRAYKISTVNKTGMIFIWFIKVYENIVCFQS